jgi:hypothetical protein
MSATACRLASFDKAALAVSIQIFVLNVIANRSDISVVIFMTDILKKKYCLLERFKN